MIITSILYLGAVAVLLLLACSGIAKDLNTRINNMHNLSYTPDQIRTVCCLCGAHKSGPVDSPIVSHGYCVKCVDKVEAELEGMTKASKPALDKAPNR